MDANYSTSPGRAFEIMGNNALSVEKIAGYFGFTLGAGEREAFAEVPFAESTLEACKLTHLLVPVLPVSILDLREKLPHKIFYQHSDAWYSGEAFAAEKGEAGWQLIRMSPTPRSLSLDWGEQQKLLGEDEYVPTARVMVFTTLSWLLAAGKWLFDGLWVSCADAPGGHRVTVGTGILLAGGTVRYVYISRTFDDCAFFLLGVSSGKKF